MAQHDLQEALLSPSRNVGRTNGGGSSSGSPAATLSTEQDASSVVVERQPRRHSNRNIRFALLFACFGFAGRSIWNQSVLATYVYLMTHENPEAVGYITAVMGMAQMLASMPTGYIVDLHRRDFMLKIASAVGLVATAVTLIEFYAIPGNSYTVLVVALAIWGVFWGIANTALSALFADSIADGDRSYYFTQRSILINLGNTMGPSMALFMFAVLGDNWTLRDCAVVMSLGQAVCLPGVLLLAFFSDDIGPGSNRMRNSDTQQSDPDNNNNTSLSEPLLSQLTGSSSNIVDSTEIVSFHQRSRQPCDLGDQQQLVERSERDYLFYCIPKHRVPAVLIAMADLTAGIASGMSIRYFPIFFVKTLHLSPIQVQVLYFLSPLLQAGLMRSGQDLSQCFGRCQVTVVYKWTGIICVLSLVVFAHLGLPAWLICTVYVLHTAFMSSTIPLTKSFLMDNVPTHERGRWSALESVNMFSWSGSSALGGILVSMNGILFNFCVTATMQFLATLPVIALMWTVDVDAPCDSSVAQESTASTSEANTDSDSESGPSSDEEEGGEDADMV